MKHPSVETRVTEALSRLIRTADFESLSVNDIIREAGISRSTFYRHFKDKYDVMNFNYFSLLNRSLEDPSVLTMEDLFVILLEAGEYNWQELRSLFSTTGVNSLHEYISSYSFEAAVNIYETGDVFARKERIRILSDTERVQLLLFCHGAALLFEEWVKGKIPLSGKETAAAMYELLPNSLQGPLPLREKRSD